jgi:LacI family transcriptional regulator
MDLILPPNNKLKKIEQRLRQQKSIIFGLRLFLKVYGNDNVNNFICITMKKRATLKDIANALNISITTVSRALNNKDDISQSTKDAVLRVAEMLNYKPNTLAVSLRRNIRNQIIGVILPSVDHYFYSTILHGIMETAHQSGFLIIIGESSQDAKKELTVIKQMIDYFVSGIIYCPSRNVGISECTKQFKEQEIPFVLIDRTFKDYQGSFVQYDDYMGGFVATEHLILQGHSRIAVMDVGGSCSVSHDRYRGYLDAMEKYNIPQLASFHKTSEDASREDGYILTKELFNQGGPKPDSIFAVLDDLAVGACHYLKDSGYSIPEDISVIGYSNSEISEHLDPPLTTVEQNGRIMGKTAFRFVIDQIDSPHKVHQVTFNSNLIIRDSCMKRIVDTNAA